MNLIRSYVVFFVSFLIAFTSINCVHSDPPPGYYDSVGGETGEALHDILHEIIDDHQRHPYTSTSSTDTWDIIWEADEDPDNSDNIIDIYKNTSYPKPYDGSWNREHTWPSSYGFPKEGQYPYTDCHHLMPSDSLYNSARGNKPFDYCLSGCDEYPVPGYPGSSNWTEGSGNTGTWEIWDNRKGDIARAMFYMDVRYEGGTHGITGDTEPDLILTDNRTLIVSDSHNVQSVAYMGILSTLLEWHSNDPVDDKERNRNDVVYSYQGNRNPFIDHPEWVCDIWGGAACTGATPTFTPTPTDFPTMIPTFTPTSTGTIIIPSSTPTFLSTFTPTPTSTPTMVPGQNMLWRIY